VTKSINTSVQHCHAVHSASASLKFVNARVIQVLGMRSKHSLVRYVSSAISAYCLEAF
jgi:hypothetical protein